jgi:endonuclease/exonuclease/phosphatase (EEP) superfamily protein YafD
MVTRFLFFFITFGLLLHGCVRIPDHHSTVGKYNELSGISTECFRKDNISPSVSEATNQIAELNSQSFIVLNWNSHRGSSRGWQEDFERLSNNIDLVVLQEGYLTDYLQEQLNKQQYHWDVAKAFTYNDIYTGVLTASKVRPDFLCSFRAVEPLSGIPKTVLITRYPLSGTDKTLLFINTHMINFSLDNSAYRAQMGKIVKVASQHRGPLIIAGDFNSWNKERLQILEDAIHELDARPVTFETDHRVSFLGQKVDHIFFRNLIPTDAVTEKVTTSDHNLMLVTFKLADEEK